MIIYFEHQERSLKQQQLALDGTNLAERSDKEYIFQFKVSHMWFHRSYRKLSKHG